MKCCEVHISINRLNRIDAPRIATLPLIINFKGFPVLPLSLAKAFQVQPLSISMCTVMAYLPHLANAPISELARDFQRRLMLGVGENLSYTTSKIDIDSLS